MNLERKLRRWRDAGLIDESISARITAFEREQQQPMAMYALIGLGAGTLGLGLISLVAANWERIPAALKLSVDLALGAALAALIEQALRRPAPLAREALITIYYAFTLASLALLGQIYQLETPGYQALLVCRPGPCRSCCWARAASSARCTPRGSSPRTRWRSRRCSTISKIH